VEVRRCARSLFIGGVRRWRRGTAVVVASELDGAPLMVLGRLRASRSGVRVEGGFQGWGAHVAGQCGRRRAWLELSCRDGTGVCRGARAWAGACA
jgi:hypothetical protein